MATLNAKRIVPVNKTVNRAGGVGFTQDAKNELVSILLTSLVEDKFYESANDQADRLVRVMQQVDPLFAAKAAVYARDTFGMRTITQLAAVALAGATFAEKRAFYRSIVVRPDDVLSILAAYGIDGRPLPNAMKRGLADALAGFKAANLAKYKGTDREVNMYDAINLLHPKSAGVDQFMKGEIRVADTWEVAISAAKTPEAKAKAWRGLILERKLGIMALLRNLRNIVLSCGKDAEVMEAVYAQLTDKNAILRSRLFPYRFLAAYYTFVPQPTAYNGGYRYAGTANAVTEAPQKLISAINRAAEISLVNVPSLPGSSALIMDVSGSMEDTMSKNSSMRMIDAGAMLGAMLFKKNPDSELVQFGTTARKLVINADMPLLDIATRFAQNPGIGHGTSIPAGIKALTNKHDRIIIVSDMQTWVGYEGGQKAWNAYNQKFHAFEKGAYGYEIDLAGYGTTSLNNRSNREFFLPTITDKIFPVMGALEQGGKGLIEAIEKVVL